MNPSFFYLSLLISVLFIHSVNAQPVKELSVASNADGSKGHLNAPLFLRQEIFSSLNVVDSVSAVQLRRGKSPGLAMLFSALVPGLGQFYAESYWKIPLIWGAGAYFVAGWIRNNNKYVNYRDQYFASITPKNPSGDSQIKLFRDFYRDQRDSFAWYFGILYLANILDAYVDAHLFEFDVSENLGIRVGPDRQQVAVKINLRW